MKLYIPEIGDKIKLTSDWSFRLFDESRNDALFKLLGIKQPGREFLQRISDGKEFFSGRGRVNNDWYQWVAADGEVIPHQLCVYSIRQNQNRGTPQDFFFVADRGTPVTLKAGQVLSIDRVYIRRGASDFSSITFNYIGAPKGSGRVRFWAKLVDVNSIEFESIE
jgi:hypothetical protein